MDKVISHFMNDFLYVFTKLSFLEKFVYCNLFGPQPTFTKVRKFVINKKIKVHTLWSHKWSLKDIQVLLSTPRGALHPHIGFKDCESNLFFFYMYSGTSQYRGWHWRSQDFSMGRGGGGGAKHGRQGGRVRRFLKNHGWKWNLLHIKNICNRRVHM